MRQGEFRIVRNSGTPRKPDSFTSNAVLDELNRWARYFSRWQLCSTLACSTVQPLFLADNSEVCLKVNTRAKYTPVPAFCGGRR